MIEKAIPRSLYRALQPSYHFLLSLTAALRYGFPSRNIVVIGITGTKGKTSTAEYLNAILEEAGLTTAVLGTLHFKIAKEDRRNLYKMTMPGRFFVQHFLSDAVRAGCTHAVIEMTSEGAKQFRQRFIDMDALIFTNLSPEHIESHGSYEKYRDAKLAIARTLARSRKQPRLMIANGDDPESKHFFSIPNTKAISYHITDAMPYDMQNNLTTFQFKGTPMKLHLPGVFSLYNAIAAATCAAHLGISLTTIKNGIGRVTTIPGRAEEISEGQPFRVVIDYAHTPDSLKSIYEAYPGETKICVLGNTGGGRDKWKRPVMGKIAEEFCHEIILTNEDPYDEDPELIIHEIAQGVSHKKPTMILERRAAIAHALSLAKQSQGKTAVIITGKGTDPYIMGPNGSKLPWDDRTVAKEELRKIFPSR